MRAETLAYPNLDEFDIIILDIGMPHMDGHEVVRALRARGVLTPIVALTGFGLREDKQKALDSGFTAHMTKPVGIKELSGVFKEYIHITTL